MLLTILFVLFLIAGIVCIIIHRIRGGYYEEDTLDLIGIINILIGSIGIICCVLIIILNNNSLSKSKAKIWYEETVESLTADYDYINTIQDDKARSVAAVEYNSKVKGFKTEIITNQISLDNLWLNWMKCYAFKDMDANAVKYIKSGD